MWPDSKLQLDFKTRSFRGLDGTLPRSRRSHHTQSRTYLRPQPRAIAASIAILIFVAILVLPGTACARHAKTITSPNGRLDLALRMAEGTPQWRLSYDDITLLGNGTLGIEVAGSKLTGFESVEVEEVTYRGVVNTLWGKFNRYDDHYNQACWTMRETSAPGRVLRIVFRVYDQGVAFRYEFPKDGNWQEAIPLSDEMTEFRFVDDYTAWSYNGERSPIGPQPLSRFNQRNGAELPLTIKCDSDTYVAVLEAAISNIAPFRLVPIEDSEVAFCGSFARSTLRRGDSTSWRVLLIGDEPGDLLVSPLMHCLNPPCEVPNSGWIRPGLAMWDWRAWGAQTKDGFTYGLDMASWRKLVNFASRTGVRYLVLDANWYGPEFEPQSDPRTNRDHLVIQPDVTKPAIIRKPPPEAWTDPIDVPALIRYAKERNVGVILYINDVARHNYPFEETLTLYHEWGAAGIKYGFMKGEGQEKVLDTREIVRLCAKYELVCDFHDDPILPSGDERTYPNYLTREFFHAQSDAMRSFSPSDFCETAFVNMIAGPLDMNNGLFTLTNPSKDRPRIFKNVESTVVAEAARVLFTYTGLAILPDTPEAYDEKADLFDFVRRLPMTWDETRILHGEFGGHISTARRSGTTWFIGSATNEQGRTLEIALDFLPPGRAYRATLYEDAPDAHFQTNREAYGIRQISVTSSETILARMAPGGGHCILLEAR